MVWQADRNSDRSSCADHPVCFTWNPYSDHGGGRRDHLSGAFSPQIVTGKIQQ